MSGPDLFPRFAVHEFPFLFLSPTVARTEFDTPNIWRAVTEYARLITALRKINSQLNKKTRRRPLKIAIFLVQIKDCFVKRLFVSVDSKLVDLIKHFCSTKNRKSLNACYCTLLDVTISFSL